MPRLDEAALRKPTFTEGHRIKLADGQVWTFPRPRLRVRPTRNAETGRIEAGGGPTFGPDYERCIDEMAETGPEQMVERLGLQMEMASILLLRNYELTDADLAELLDTDLDSPESGEMWSQINPVLLGTPPKPSPDGSATP